MNIVGAIVIYLIVWWCALFAVLPLDIKGRWEEKDDGVKGADPGAPVTPGLKRKLLITSGVAFVVWAAILAVLYSGVINYRD